ncbi:hypothetical protein T484DRAFT_1623627, partial [Baffinella frigidus]
LEVAADLTYEATEVGLGDEKAGGLLCATNFAQSEGTGAETIRTLDSNELVRGTIRMRRDDFGALFRGRSAHFLAFGWRGGLRQSCLMAHHTRRRAEKLTPFRGKKRASSGFCERDSQNGSFYLEDLFWANLSVNFRRNR